MSSLSSPSKPGMSGFADKLTDPFDIIPSGLQKVIAPFQKETLDKISPPPKDAPPGETISAPPTAVEVQNNREKDLLKTRRAIVSQDGEKGRSSLLVEK